MLKTMSFQSWEWVSFATLLCCNCVWNDTYPKWQINFKCVYGIMGNHKWCVICGLLPSQWSKCPQCASAALCVQQSGIITNHKMVHNMKFQKKSLDIEWTLTKENTRKKACIWCTIPGNDEFMWCWLWWFGLCYKPLFQYFIPPLQYQQPRTS